MRLAIMPQRQRLIAVQMYGIVPMLGDHVGAVSFAGR